MTGCVISPRPRVVIVFLARASCRLSPTSPPPHHSTNHNRLGTLLPFGFPPFRISQSHPTASCASAAASARRCDGAPTSHKPAHGGDEIFATPPSAITISFAQSFNQAARHGSTEGTDPPRYTRTWSLTYKKHIPRIVACGAAYGVGRPFPQLLLILWLVVGIRKHARPRQAPQVSLNGPRERPCNPGPAV